MFKVILSLMGADMQKKFQGMKTLFLIAFYDGGCQKFISWKTGQKTGQNRLAYFSNIYDWTL